MTVKNRVRITWVVLLLVAVTTGCGLAGEVGPDEELVGSEDERADDGPIGDEGPALAEPLAPLAALTNCGGFTDVATTSYACDAVDRVAAAGITRGCNPPSNTQFCPIRAVTRAEMATFLVRALGLSTGTTSCGFTDVTSSNVHATSICAMKASGITVGCNPPSNTQYCPSQAVTRGQMAAFLARALAIPGCTLSNYTDVPATHVFASAICGIWKEGIAVSYRHPDPVNNRYNTTYGPDAPMLRGDLAVFLDRALLAPPADPLRATVSSTYQALLTDAQAYAYNSNTDRRAGEVVSLVYLYRAARKVRNLPAGFDPARLLTKITAGGDTLAAMYQTGCFSGHDGPGSQSCARFHEVPVAGEDLDSGSDKVVALLEATRLLFEVGGAANIAKAKTWWPKALAAVAHVNGDHRVTTPCVGWEVNAGGDHDGMLKWNKSNRWAIANFLVADVRARWNAHVGGDGSTYRANAVAAATCFRNDLRNASKYRCNAGARCYDAARGTWWTGYHSAHTASTYARIEEDPGHGSATAEIVFFSVHDRWGVMGYDDLEAFKRHFELRRLASTTEVRPDGGIGRQFAYPQYPDSDSYPGNTCARGSSCTAKAIDWDSRKTGAYNQLGALYGDNAFRAKVLNLEPTWSRFGSGDYVGVRAAAFAIFGEVGSPRRLGL